MKSRLYAGISAVCCLLMIPSLIQAAPIRTLPDLSAISIFEQSGSAETQLFYIPGTAIGDAALNVRLPDRLSFENNDFVSNANEYYDFFFSDADGSFNIDGAFLTITAIFDNDRDAGLNIDAVRLEFVGGGLEYASSVASFVALGNFASPGSVNNALGNDLSTTTLLGDTLGLPDSTRLSLTLGFDSSAPPPSVIPVPPAVWLFGTALVGLVGYARRRKST